MEKQQSNNFQDYLHDFQSISLAEMDEVALMKRTDTKFVFEFDLLQKMLKEAVNHYRILEINGNRFADYKTDYFDTKDYRLFINHQNGKLNRYKVRFREYIGSNLSFLEVKFKNNKGKTLKSRVQSWCENFQFQDSDNEFIQRATPYSIQDLTHILTNNFSRITLVSKTDKERLTIDFQLNFTKNDLEIKLPNLVIAEVKQEKVDRNSAFMKILKQFGIRKASFSKYATGAAILNPDLKQNKFKENILFLNKIHNNELYIT